MTEAEWMASENPAAMLRAVETWRSMQSHNVATSFVVSNRKLRLWVEACRERWPQWKGEGDLGDVATLGTCVRFWSSGWVVTKHARPLCDLLRDISGNPWRPVTTESLGISSMDGLAIATSIAQAAYDKRTGRACEKCGGRKTIKVPPSKSTFFQLVLEQDAWKDCSDCHGTGRIDDGTLDPAHLAVLADALEEAGCLPQPPGRTRAEVVRLRKHEVMFGGCCERFADRKGCDCLAEACDEGLLAHLRSAGPHVRGCWAVDLILGKE